MLGQLKQLVGHGVANPSSGDRNGRRGTGCCDDRGSGCSRACVRNSTITFVCVAPSLGFQSRQEIRVGHRCGAGGPRRCWSLTSTPSSPRVPHDQTATHASSTMSREILKLCRGCRASVENHGNCSPKVEDAGMNCARVVVRIHCVSTISVCEIRSRRVLSLTLRGCILCYIVVRLAVRQE
jgi:hypothetical protein